MLYVMLLLRVSLFPSKAAASPLDQRLASEYESLRVGKWLSSYPTSKTAGCVVRQGLQGAPSKEPKSNASKIDTDAAYGVPRLENNEYPTRTVL